MYQLNLDKLFPITIYLSTRWLTFITFNQPLFSLCWRIPRFNTKWWELQTPCENDQTENDINDSAFYEHFTTITWYFSSTHTATGWGGMQGWISTRFVLFSRFPIRSVIALKNFNETYFLKFVHSKRNEIRAIRFQSWISFLFIGDFLKPCVRSLERIALEIKF